MELEWWTLSIIQNVSRVYVFLSDLGLVPINILYSPQRVKINTLPAPQGSKHLQEPGHPLERTYYVELTSFWSSRPRKEDHSTNCIKCTFE